MKINHIMSISKILINLCAIKQNKRVKKTFSDIAYRYCLVKKV